MKFLAAYAAWRDRRAAARRWRFIGFVTGRQSYVDDSGNDVPGSNLTQIHSLFEKGNGERRVDTIGRNLHSPHARHARASVNAWAAGGPVPQLDDGGPFDPPPKPKTKPADLIVFPGGKGAA